MERRTFLKAASLSFPMAGLEALASGQGSMSAASGQAHVVDEGHDRLGETHSLGYSTMLFKVLTRDTGGGLFVIEHKNLLKGGPPVHLHHSQEEWFYVMEGEVLFQVGGERKRLHAGDSILGPRGIPHGFAAVGERPARMVITFAPAGKMEAFFREAAVPNGPKMDAALFARYEMEYVGPPLVVG